MNIIKSYKELCTEIEMWKYRIQAYQAEVEALKRLAKIDGPSEVGAIDYSRPNVQTSGQMGFQEYIVRLQHLEKHIYLHQDTIRRMIESKKNIEKCIEKLEGLDKKVVYMRDIEKKSLLDISNCLGYSYQYIKEISARNK